MKSAEDAHWMAKALRLAERGKFTVSPNPVVGCVIVQGSQLVGEGWHQRAGEPHAEVYALRQAGESARGATAYVTLEPCSHVGRTPPCADALIAAGVSRVVVAMQDPNPAVSGRGLMRLRQAGISVSVGLMADSARALNVGFLSRMERGRPFVRAKLATSLDGRSALGNGLSQWITGEAARADVHRLRAQSSAMVTGVDTVIADNPRLTVRLKDLASVRQPLRFVLDSRLRSPDDAIIFSGEQPAVLVAGESGVNDPVFAARLSVWQDKGVTVVLLPEQSGRVDLLAFLAYVAKVYQVNDLMVEAGARLTGAFLEQSLVDELWWYQNAALMGNEARASVILFPLMAMEEVRRWSLLEQRRLGSDWCFRLSPKG